MNKDINYNVSVASMAIRMRIQAFRILKLQPVYSCIEIDYYYQACGREGKIGMEEL